MVAVAALSSCELFPQPTGTCQGPSGLIAPDTVVAEAFHNDCDGPGSSNGDIYQLTLLTQTDVKFLMTPNGFRGKMSLFRGVYGDVGPHLIFDVLGSGGAAFGARAYLPAGQYFLVAGPANNTGGPFELAVTATAAVDCAFFDWTDVGSTVNGAITTADCAGTGGVHQDNYGIWLNLGESIEVTATAGAKPLQVILRRAGDPTVPNIAERSLVATASTTISYTATSRAVYYIQFVGQPSAIGAISYSMEVESP